VSTETPRIAPGGRREIGLVNTAFARLAGRVAGTPAPNIFLTLGRHPRLFRAWLRFAGRLMPFGRLPRTETELVILRVAHNCGSEYERNQHVRLGRRVGLSQVEIDRVADGPDGPGWSPRQVALLRAADELHAQRELGDEAWAALAQHFDDRGLIEVCMLIAHYEMLAMVLASLRVQPEPRAFSGDARPH
jgi:alkylhydroperoxidase family enzyme